MKAKKLLLPIALVVLTGCAGNQTTAPADWHDYVIPLENSEYITDVQSYDKNRAAGFANKMIWEACDHYNKQPNVIEQNITRTGVMPEKVADTYEVVRSVTKSMGKWTPSANDEEYTAAFRFKCI